MANICDFSMCCIYENKDDFASFVGAMTQSETYWMGRGAEVDVTDTEIYDNGYRSVLSGDCKWSVASALINNAEDMKKQKVTGEGYWYDDGHFNEREYITLFEACEKWHINMEAFSEEDGYGFQEHLVYVVGYGVKENECVDYHEIWFDDYDTKEEAEEELNLEISDFEWEDGIKVCGGFEWDFELEEYMYDSEIERENDAELPTHPCIDELKSLLFS